MMQNFIKILDLEYVKMRKENDIEKENKNFAIFFPLKIELYNNVNMNYIIKKSEFTKFLYIKNGARVYFSDADILTMLLQIREKNTIEKMIDNLARLYQGKGDKFSFYVEQGRYEALGLPEIANSQILDNPQDIEISFEDLLTLINMILAKDAASKSLWDNNPEFLKHTIIKYILLLKYYYLKDKKVESYLDSIGYDTRCSIYKNYDTRKNQKKNNKIFYNFDVIEKAEIL